MPRKYAGHASKGLTLPKSKNLKMRVVHSHGCRVCRRRYTDVCEDWRIDGVCALHRARFPRGRSVWDRGQDPQWCCPGHSALADDATREAFALGGPGPWWQCTECRRTHPFDPSVHVITPDPKETTS